jgi:hypothetical protein
VTEHSLPPEHPDDELVELALGDVDEPYRSRLIQHLVSCARCRAVYEVLVDAIDGILPAAPAIAPSVGFEQRALDAMGAAAGPQPPPIRGQRREGRVRTLIAAAAAVLAAVVGGATALVVWDDDGQTTVSTRLATDTSPLRTSDGEVVGFAALSSLHDRPALIVSVSGTGAKGVGYHCRVLYASGRKVQTGHPWALDDPGGSTWLEAPPDGRIVGMQLVTDDGRVWARARLT